MAGRIRVGICGYGNLGRGVETEIVKNPDMELAAIFTRRPESATSRSVPVVPVDSAAGWADKVDAMILCGGSALDLPAQGPGFAALFNTVDSYDTHTKIPQYYESVDAAAKASGHVAVISAGWDPGLFSLLRLYSGAILPKGAAYTFWGKGVSQGHSGVIRGIKGVVDAIQYTIPIEAAMDSVRRGENPDLSTRQKHTRLCYVVAEAGADTARIEAEIKGIPYYFADNDTTVYFISREEFEANHGKMTHGGNMIYSGETGDGNKQVVELSLKLDSNPEFTSSVMIACARAAYRLSAAGESGARTVFDIPPIMYCAEDRADLIRKIL